LGSDWQKRWMRHTPSIKVRSTKPISWLAPHTDPLTPQRRRFLRSILLLSAPEVNLRIGDEISHVCLPYGTCSPLISLQVPRPESSHCLRSISSKISRKFLRAAPECHSLLSQSAIDFPLVHEPRHLQAEGERVEWEAAWEDLPVSWAGLYTPDITVSMLICKECLKAGAPVSG